MQKNINKQIKENDLTTGMLFCGHGCGAGDHGRTPNTSIEGISLSSICMKLTCSEDAVTMCYSHYVFD